MKRTPLKRKTPLRAKPDSIKTWKQRSAAALPARSKGRAGQERRYSSERQSFLDAHPLCPITGERTTDIHHSAGREGAWLNLQYYWIALSREGHRLVTDNGTWAESVGLMVRVRQTYDHHVQCLIADGRDIDLPLFYTRWSGKNLIPGPR